VELGAAHWVTTEQSSPDSLHAGCSAHIVNDARVPADHHCCSIDWGMMQQHGKEHKAICDAACLLLYRSFTFC
jgi:hypothetical protein